MVELEHALRGLVVGGRCAIVIGVQQIKRVDGGWRVGVHLQRHGVAVRCGVARSVFHPCHVGVAVGVKQPFVGERPFQRVGTQAGKAGDLRGQAGFQIGAVNDNALVALQRRAQRASQVGLGVVGDGRRCGTCEQLPGDAANVVFHAVDGDGLRRRKYVNQQIVKRVVCGHAFGGTARAGQVDGIGVLRTCPHLGLYIGLHRAGERVVAAQRHHHGLVGGVVGVQRDGQVAQFHSGQNLSAGHQGGLDRDGLRCFCSVDDVVVRHKIGQDGGLRGLKVPAQRAGLGQPGKVYAVGIFEGGRVHHHVIAVAGHQQGVDLDIDVVVVVAFDAQFVAADVYRLDQGAGIQVIDLDTAAALDHRLREHEVQHGLAVGPVRDEAAVARDEFRDAGRLKIGVGNACADTRLVARHVGGSHRDIGDGGLGCVCGVQATEVARRKGVAPGAVVVHRGLHRVTRPDFQFNHGTGLARAGDRCGAHIADGGVGRADRVNHHGERRALGAGVARCVAVAVGHHVFAVWHRIGGGERAQLCVIDCRNRNAVEQQLHAGHVSGEHIGRNFKHRAVEVGDVVGVAVACAVFVRHQVERQQGRGRGHVHGDCHRRADRPQVAGLVHVAVRNGVRALRQRVQRRNAPGLRVVVGGVHRAVDQQLRVHHPSGQHTDRKVRLLFGRAVVRVERTGVAVSVQVGCRHGLGGHLGVDDDGQRRAQAAQVARVVAVAVLDVVRPVGQGVGRRKASVAGVVGARHLLAVHVEHDGVNALGQRAQVEVWRVVVGGVVAVARATVAVREHVGRARRGQALGVNH